MNIDRPDSCFSWPATSVRHRRPLAGRQGPGPTSFEEALAEGLQVGWISAQ